MPQNFTQVRHLSISPEQAGQRIDNFLLRELKNIPKSHIYQLLRSGQVRVNGGRVKPTRRLESGDELRLPPMRNPDRTAPRRVPDAAREEILQAILFESDELMVLNKPAGWAAHAGTGIPYGIIEALRQAREELSYLELAHRLDRETSGCLLLAKTRAMLEQLHAGLRQGSSGPEKSQQAHAKTYLALLAGQWQGGIREVSLPLAAQRLESGERMVKVDTDAGKHAYSRFECLEQFQDACLVRITIRTGRMHQIRVHAQALGHPVLGDQKYGERQLNAQLRRQGLKRMFLHASAISLMLDSGLQHYEAPLPDDLTALLGSLRHA